MSWAGLPASPDPPARPTVGVSASANKLLLPAEYVCYIMRTRDSEVLWERFTFDSASGGIALDISSDGNVVAGRFESHLGDEAFVWMQVSGMRSLQEFLVVDQVTFRDGD